MLFHAQDTNGSTISTLLMIMILLALILIASHLIITQVGMIFVEAEILRIGNEQLLNNFEEGIIIYSQDTREALFANKAVKGLARLKNLDDSIQNVSYDRLNDSD